MRSPNVNSHVIFLLERAVAVWVITSVWTYIWIFCVASIVFHQGLLRYETCLTIVAAESDEMFMKIMILIKKKLESFYLSGSVCLSR
jgi:hypothetical protein